jgi:uncharacterized protein YndB with AHSA1/START domain
MFRLSLPLAVITGLLVAPGDSIDTSLFPATTEVQRQLRFEKDVPAPPAAVFASWATSEGVRDFLDIDSKVELWIGGAYELYFDRAAAVGERGSEGCQVLSFVPGRMLSFSWNAPPTFPEERAARSWIVITFDPLDDGQATRVRVEHLGFGKGGNWGQVRQYFRRAWPRTLDSLVLYHSD